MLTLALEDAIDEVALVEAAISPLVATTSIFLSLVVFAFKLNFTAFPCFRAESMLLIVHPFAFIGATFGVDECASAIRHTIEPLALVDAAIGLDHATQSRHLVSHKLALILGAIWPDQNTKTVLHLAPILEHPIPRQIVSVTILVCGLRETREDTSLSNRRLNEE